jgi:hypothetical protein
MLRTLALSAAVMLIASYASAETTKPAQAGRVATCADFQRYPSEAWKHLLRITIDGRPLNTAATFEKQCRKATPETPLRVFIREPHPKRALRDGGRVDARS